MIVTPKERSVAETSGMELSARVKQWMWIGIILAVVGIAFSIYSTNHHLQLKAFGETDASCNISATVSCDAVAASKYSEIAGIPLGVYGIGYFVAILTLIGFVLAGGKSAKEHLIGYSGLVAIGAFVSIVLGILSTVAVGAACLACIGIYSVTALQAIAAFIYRDQVPRPVTTGVPAIYVTDNWLKDATSGGTTAAIAVAAVVALFTFIKPSIAPKAPAEQAAKAGPDAPRLAAKVDTIPVSKSAYSGLGEDFRKGPDTAKVQIVEFADYQCPACGQVKVVLDQLEAEYKDKIQIVFRNFPLDNTCNQTVQQKMHEFACNAAVMARCAGQYGKFWEMHGTLFAKQRELSNEKIKEFAKGVGLTDDQIKTCWDSKDILAKIKDDVALGTQLAIDSTPTLFINGRKVIGGRGINDLRQDIDELLK